LAAKRNNTAFFQFRQLPSLIPNGIKKVKIWRFAKLQASPTSTCKNYRNIGVVIVDSRLGKI